jgi:hypothetical protein
MRGDDHRRAVPGGEVPEEIDDSRVPPAGTSFTSTFSIAG